jgi:hypothetical protein
MNNPEVVSRRALEGKRVALSASKSADLGRLGLSEYHCRLVIAEVGRALMLAGATVVYGGNLSADGYTDILLEEAQRFGGNDQVLELTIPESEYTQYSGPELNEIDARLGEHGKLLLVRSDSVLERVRDLNTRPADQVNSAEALSAMRAYVSLHSDARILVGGKLANYQGSLPGVIEEAILTAEAGKALLVAGGFGGAAAAISNALDLATSNAWQPTNFPEGENDEVVTEALQRLRTAGPDLLRRDEESERLLNVLAVSHRPADISSSVVRLLAENLERPSE